MQIKNKSLSGLEDPGMDSRLEQKNPTVLQVYAKPHGGRWEKKVQAHVTL